MVTNKENSAPNKYGNSTHSRMDTFFQPKLTVNQPNDVYEQEADAMANKVMRMPAGGAAQQPFFKAAATTINRKCQHCEEEEGKVHRKEGSGTETQGSPELDNYVGGLGTSGQSISASHRQFFEPRFGHDFSGVKIHTDTVAAKSAQSINALAYTSGNNIVFNSGQYSPESDSGKKLLAHELTHVVQQSGGVSRKVQGNAPPNRVQRQTVPPVTTSGDTDVDAMDVLIKATQWKEAYDKLDPLTDERILQILVMLKVIVDTTFVSSLTYLARNKPATVAAKFDSLLFRAQNFVSIGSPMHSDELNGKKDKLETQTFSTVGDQIPDVMVEDEQVAGQPAVKRTLDKDLSIFVPAGTPAMRNQVHIFFTPYVASNPDAAAGSVAQQGLRAQTDSSGWILIGVPALGEKDVPNFVTINTAEIQACLAAAGRSTTIDAIRLSAHSRGHRGLENTMGLKPGSKPMIGLGLVEKITVFDASYHDLGQAINQHKKELTAMDDPNNPGNFKADAIQLYDVTLANISGLKGTHLDAALIRALSYARLIQEGLAKNQISTTDLNVLPKNIMAATNTILGLLPVRGDFSTKDPPPSGKTNIQKFYTDNRSSLSLLDTRNIKMLIHDKTLDDGMDFSAKIDAHHWFVAELAHEAVE